MSTTALVSHSSNPITEDWLRSAGFKWHEEHQYVASVVRAKEQGEVLESRKHWTLWLGGVANTDEEGRRDAFSDDEDLGLELSRWDETEWHCWLRADTSRRYSRFIHIRHVRKQHEVIALVVALSGRSWQPENHMYGKIFTASQAESIRQRDQRLDIVIAQRSPWYESEKDESSGRADITDLRINREKDGFV